MRLAFVPLYLLVMVAAGTFGYFGYDYFLSTREYVPYVERGLASVTVKLAAVDEYESGILIPLTIELKEGSGKIFADIDDVSFIYDTQDSMRLAVSEAERITGYELTDVDVVFSLETEAGIVGGPSAGAAMTVAAAAAILNKDLRDDVVITGAIAPGGALIEVGAIIEKAQAAKEVGATLFLVPPGESVVSHPVEHCVNESTNGYYYEQCTVIYESVNVSEYVGIDVQEIRYIEDALEIMLVD